MKAIIGSVSLILLCCLLVCVGPAEGKTGAATPAQISKLSLGVSKGAVPVSSLRPSRHDQRRRYVNDACYAAFPDAHRETIGRTTWYNRQESVRTVLCYRFGLRPSADFPVSASMVCGMVSAVIGKAFARKLALYVDGTCSGVELASAPREPSKYIGIACGWASALLKGKFLDIASSVGCALAPSAGHSLGGLLESKHEFDVAVDVVLHGRCIKYSPTHFGSPWLAERCSKRDHGFASLPRWSAPSSGGGSPGASSPGGESSDGGGGSSDGAGGVGGGNTLTISPSSIVSGQFVYIDSPFSCQNTDLDTLLEIEIFPEGSYFDGLTDSTHATYWIGGTPTISMPKALATMVTEPGRVLKPGDYELGARCLHESDGSVISESQRAHLTVTEPARSVAISPEVVAHGDTITITPDQPCASLAGATIGLSIEVWDADSGLNYSVSDVGTTGPGCMWGPIHYTFPAEEPYDLWSGNCRITVEIYDPDTGEYGFSYLPQTIQLTD